MNEDGTDTTKEGWVESCVRPSIHQGERLGAASLLHENGLGAASLSDENGWVLSPLVLPLNRKRYLGIRQLP